ITSTRTPTDDYLPISPTLKRLYPMQIRLQNNRAVIGNRAVLQVTALRKNSYLRIDCSYEVSIVVLEGTVDSLGGGLRVRVKKEG
ncbi:hypothetical protein BKA61DRAFT_454870, partial [Leptodontidium sp. MPI-SDFR-AT-0119]